MDPRPQGVQIPSHVLRGFLQEDDCDVGKVQILLDKGLDAKEEIGDYGRMLHYAALWQSWSLATCSRSPAARIWTSPTRSTELRLQIAAHTGKGAQDIVQLLLDLGANATIGSGHYGAPL